MKQTTANDRAPAQIVDYSAARARAIEWLGDRYLLARPINAPPKRIDGRAKLTSGTNR